MVCEYTSSTPRNSKVAQNKHVKTCKKCALKNQATNLKISIHEWPLPTNENQAKAAVFELEIPKTFLNWREATYHLLLCCFVSDIPQWGQSKLTFAWFKYKDIQKWGTTHKGRLQLASSVVRKFLILRLVAKTTVAGNVTFSFCDIKPLLMLFALGLWLILNPERIFTGPLQ